MYEAVLVPIHENILAYAYEYLPGEKAEMGEAFQDWRHIIEALERRDTELAERLVRDHTLGLAAHVEKNFHYLD